MTMIASNEFLSALYAIERGDFQTARAALACMAKDADQLYELCQLLRVPAEMERAAQRGEASRLQR